MSVVAASTMRTRTIEPASRPSRGSHTASFKDILAAMREPASGITLAPPLAAPQPTFLQQPDSIVVHQGDCLSRICSEQLKEQGSAVSQRGIRAAVKEVAKANNITDPDKIYVGQTLDISMLATFASGGENPNASIVQESAKQWKSLADGAVGLSSGFGLRKDPFTGQVNQHNGIDVVAPAGASIRACAAGSVIFSGWKPGYGNTVIIRHEDGVESVYGHASKLLVHVGEQVANHTPIGCVGSTGRSTGAHLHFEVRRNGQALNPITLLNGDSFQVALADAG